MPVIQKGNDPLGILGTSQDKSEQQSDPLGILKKKVDGQKQNPGGQEQKQNGTSPTQSPSQLPLAENQQNQEEPDYINLSKQANQLLVPTYKPQPTMMSGGMMGMGTTSPFQEQEEYKVSPEKEKQSVALKNQIKAAGYNPDKLAKDVEGINDVFFKNPIFSNKQLLSDYKENPQLYERKIATAKWQSELYNSLKDKVNHNDYNKALDALNNLSIPNLDYGTKRSNINDIVRIVKNSGIDKEKSDDIIKNLYTDLSNTYASTPIPANDELYSKGLNDYQITAYHSLEDLSPSQAIRYKSALIDDKNISDSYTAQFDKENSLKRLEEVGISMKKNWALEQINKYSKEYKDLYDSAENGTASQADLDRLTQLEATIKPYRDEYEKANEAENTIHKRYPNVIKEEANSYAKDLIGQKGFLGETGDFISSRFTELGKSTINAGSSLWEMLSTPFLNDEQRDIQQSQILGFESLYANRYHRTSDKDEEIYQKRVLNPYLQNEVDKIKNDSTLTYEEKVNKTHKLLMQEPISEWKTEGLSEPKSNLSIKSLLYGVTDMAVNLIPFFAAEGLTGGGFSGALTAGVLTGFHDNYVKALESGSKNPYSDAAVSTAIFSTAMAVGDFPGKIKEAIGNTTPIGKLINKLDDKSISKILKSGNEPTALKILKKTYNLGVNVVESTAKGIPPAAGFTASMSAGKILNDVMLNDVKSPSEYLSDYQNSTLHFIPFNAFMGIGGKMLRGEMTESPSNTLTKNALITAASQPNLHLSIVDEKLKDGSYTPQQANQIKNNIIKANTLLQSTPMVDVKGEELNDSDKRELLFLKMQESDAVAMLGKDIPNELKDNINKKLEKVRSKISSIYKGEYVPEEVKAAKKTEADESLKPKEQVPEPDLSNISNLIHQEDINTAQSIMDRVNNNESINVDDIEKGRTILYNTLDAHPEAAHLIEPLIQKLESHENLTKTETVQTTEREPIEGTLAAKRKIEIKPALEQSTGSTARVTLADGTTAEGTLKIKDGNYVLEVEGQEPIVIGEKQITDRDLKVPEGESPVELDEDGNVKSATFETKDGHKVTITDPEKALDLGIQLSLETLGEIPDEAFDKEYQDVVKEDKIEVPVEKPKKAEAGEEPQVPELSEQEYKDFKEKGIVSDERLNNIADKVMNKQELSDKEKEIQTSNKKDIDKLIKEKEKENERKKKIEEFKKKHGEKKEGEKSGEDILKELEDKGTKSSDEKSLNELAEKNKGNKLKTKIIEQARKAIKTLKSIFPNMDIHLHENEQDFNDVMDKIQAKKSTGGNFAYVKNADGTYSARIDINLDKANLKTIAHEVTHAILFKTFGENQALFQSFRDKISKVLNSATEKNLQKFADNPYYKKTGVSAEEYLAELSGLLSNKSINPLTLSKIASAINEFVSKLTGGKFIPFENVNDAKDVIEFFDKVSKAIKSGSELKEITQESKERFKIDTLGVVGKIIPSQFKSKSSLSSGEIKRFPINEKVKVEEDVPISRFKDKQSNLIESDRMTGGYISDSKGNPLFKFYGGVFYPIITGKWWASRNETKAKAIAENGNKNRDADGYIYCTPMIGSDKQHMSNTDMLSVTVELMKLDANDKKSKVKKADIISSIEKAFNRKDVQNKKSLLRTILKKSNNINEIFDELEYALFQEGDKILDRNNKSILDENGDAISNFTFEERLAIVNTILGDPKVKDVRFPSAGSITDAAKRFEEPVTAKANAIGDVVTVMRTKGTLKYKKTENTDAFYHKSYPVEIYAVDEQGNPAEIEVYILDGAYGMKETFPSLTQSSGKEFTWDEYIQKHKSENLATAQYNRTAKLSSATGKIKGEGFIKSSSQLVEPTSDKWTPSLTEKEVDEVTNGAYTENLSKKATEGAAHATQVATTKGTYIKWANWLKSNFPNIKNARVLDVGAGFGHIHKPFKQILGVDAESYEPFYNKQKYLEHAGKEKPNYVNMDASDVPKGKFDVVVNNAVLNVVPRDIRDNVVRTIGESIKPGGMGVISAMNFDYTKNQINKINEGKSKNIKLSDSEVFTYESGKYTYQKGFKTPELVAYVQDVLGDGYDVKAAPSGLKQMATVVIEKNAAKPEIKSKAQLTDISIEPIDFENESENIDVYEASDDASKIAKDNGVNILRGKDLRNVALNKNGDVVGGLWTEINDNDFSFDIAVDKSVQGKGVGEKLVKEAISEFNAQNYDDHLKYKIDVTNPIMEKLLSKYGFKVIDRIHGHAIMEHPTNNPKLELPKQKEKPYDTKDITGLPSKVGEGKEPIPTEPITKPSEGEVKAGGVLQAPGAEGEGKGAGEIISRSQDNQDEKLNDMKDIVKDLIDEGKSLEDITKQVTGELGDNSKETKELISQAHSELTKKPEARVSGVSHESLTRTAERLGMDLPQRGKGTTPEQQQLLGQEFIAAGINPEDVANDFIKSGKKKVSGDELSVAQAHYANLQKAAQEAMNKYGRDSKQCQDAVAEMQLWQDEILKPMGTIFHELGQGLQATTDIDTGSYIAIENAVKQKTGQDLTPEQQKKVTEITDKSKKAQEDLKNTQDKLTEHIDNAIAEEEKKEDFNNKLKKIVSKVKKSILPSFLTKFKAGLKSKPQLTESEQQQADALSDAVVKMENLLKKGVDYSQAIKQAVEGLVKLNGEENRAEIENGFKDYYDNKGWEEEEETPEQKKAKSNIKRLEKELEDLRRGIEKGKPVKREITDREKQLQKQIQDEKDFIAYNKLVTELQGKKDNNFTMEQVKAIWEYTKKEYLDKGVEDFDDIFNGVATDLGLTPDQVRRAISQPKGAKAITEEMYRNKRIRDNAVQYAKDYVKSVDNPNALKFMKTLPAFFFSLRTFGHGTVGFITHAGMDALNPKTWKMYFPHFLKQFQYAYGNTAKYEAAMADLVRDKDFIFWKNAGLAIDPKESYSEYEGLKKMFGKLGMAGDRGFNALKVYRLAKAKYEYSKLSNTEKADPKMAKYIAEYINRSTGTTDVQVPGFINTALFAPKLIASQFERITTQPIKALATLSKGSKASPAERAAAKIVVKNCASVIATYAGALAVNGALLSLAGSKQSINYTDPSKKDWLRFKIGDKQLDISAGIIPSMNFIGSIAAYSVASKNSKKEIQDAGTNFLLGKVSPLASTIKDILYQQDFHGDIMPFSNKQPTPGHHKLTWKEYLLKSQAPIPVAEAMTDFYKSAEEKGMKKTEIEDYLNAAFMGTISGFTGAKLKEITPGTEEKPVFTEKEMKAPVLKDLSESGLEIPELGTRLSYTVKPDEAHPKGIMTTEEFKKFSDLVIKYSHDYTNEVISDSYTSDNINKLKKLVDKESDDPKIQTEITELKKEIKSVLEKAHQSAIKQARNELGLYTK